MTGMEENRNDEEFLKEEEEEKEEKLPEKIVGAGEETKKEETENFNPVFISSHRRTSSRLKSAEQSGSKSSLAELSLTIFDFIEVFVYAFAIVLIIMTFVGRHSPVNGSSMYPTLENGDLVVLSDLGYDEIENGDIVVFQSEGIGYDEPLVKRVIAKGGQTVNIDFSTWTVVVDGEVVEEDYINYKAGQTMLNYYDGFEYPLTIPEGYLFCMGDNRNDSLDSRSPRVGLVDERAVIGKVLFRLYPFSKIGSVYN